MTSADERLTALRDRLAGVELDVGSGRLAQYSYDASNYRVVPLAVAHPRGVGEVQRILRACHELRIPVTARGGGTSMAGNALGRGVVIDLSRHLNRVLDVDPEARTALVEPGVVLDNLQAAVAGHGLAFGPDPSSHSRCTIGGMIGNDACGNHSVRHGRTVDHVVSLRLLLANGVEVIAERGGLRAVDPAEESFVAGLAERLRRLTLDHLAEIRVELGRIPRQVSGFQLQHLLPERGFDVAKALVGSEGTCAIVVGATVRLVPTATASALVVLGYRDVVDAAEDVSALLEFTPSAVEGMDERIVETMRHRRGAGSVAGLPDGRAWLYVELDGDDPDQVRTRVDQLVVRLRSLGRLVAANVVGDASARRSLWRVREDGAGLAARLVGGTESWPGWEDAAVAPEHLAAYLRDFRALLEEFTLVGVLYGHFGAGCVHVRIDFDMTTPEGVGHMRRFLVRAAELVVRHGGTLSGEHGDGRARGELLPIMYSATMIDAFAAFKRIFDPDAVLNPEIIVSPPSAVVDLALSAPPVLEGTAFHFPEDPTGFGGAARRCVGIGRCRADSGGFMCPSYRATGDERDSTRGRARVLQEMITGGVITDGWRSTEVKDALDLCLSCKACSTDCPAGVDMATYKAEFLHRHHRGRLRPRSHYSLGWLPLWSRLAGFVAGPVNAVLASRLGPLLARAGGVTTERRVPAFRSRRALRRELVAPDAAPRAVFLVDSFTAGFRPELAGAVTRVLSDAGVPVVPMTGLCCGLTWVSTGQLDVARSVMSMTAKALSEGPHADLPIVVAEPSCAAALRKDLPELLGTDQARAVSARIRTFGSALAELAEDGWRPPAVQENGVLQQHCHEYAVFPDQGGPAPAVREAKGCCGLAGNFGFETEHYETSMDVAALALGPLLDAVRPGEPVLADGFSCQTQIAHLTGEGGARAEHYAEFLDRHLYRRRSPES